MKKILSLVLAITTIAMVFCGCAEEYTVKVSKNGKTKVSIFTSIPVETIEEMQQMDVPDDMGDSDNLDLEADYMTPSYNEEDAMIPSYDEEALEDMEIKVVDGVECYVSEENKSFSSTKKANKYMLKEYGEDAVGYFKTFKVTTKEFNATMVEDFADAISLYGDEYKIKLNITLPYVITKTNGTLSDNKKTVTFDLTKDKKLYAYTTKSKKSAKVYFKKDYLKSNSSAYISWNKVKGANKYKLQYKASDAKKWKSVTTTKTSKTIKKLKAGKKYTFKVTAIKDGKKYTSIKTYVNTLKKVEASVKAKTKSTVKISWKKNTKADGYIIYKKINKKDEWQKVKTIKSPYTKEYTVKKLKSGTKYYFKVVSYSNENGKKVKSSGKAFTAKTTKA